MSISLRGMKRSQAAPLPGAGEGDWRETTNSPGPRTFVPGAGVGGVAAGAGAALDGDAADDGRCLDESRVEAAHGGVGVDAVAGQSGADGEAGGWVVGELLGLGPGLGVGEEG